MIPSWLRAIRPTLDAAPPAWFLDHVPPTQVGRRSAVLVLFSSDIVGRTDLSRTRVVITERAHTLRSHAAQLVFPGGHVEPGESDEQAALREAAEEIGLDPTTVELVDTLPTVYLAPNDTSFTAVVGWWREAHSLQVVDPAEVNAVLQPTVAELLEPRNRFIASAPGGYRGPAFDVDGLVCWGVTANLLTVVLELAGLDTGWDDLPVRGVPDYLLAPYYQ